MPFVPKTEEEILLDMISYVRTNSKLTDFNVGSVIRTILEAAALEDREQYMRMVQILKAFSYRSASGNDLDRRASDFNITRLPGSKGIGYIILMDNGLNRSYLSNDVVSGATTAIVEDASVFSSLPMNVRIGEKTTDQEENQITASDLNTNIVTFASALTRNHQGLSSLGTSINEWEINAARISEVDGSADTAINSGLMVAAPAVADLPAISFSTTKSGFLLNGDFQTDLIPIVAMASGPDSTVGPKRIRSFPSGIPFSNALVTNPSTTGGGSYGETDVQFAERIEQEIGAIGSATVNAIIAKAKTVSLPVTEQKVQKVSVREEFVINVNAPGDGRVTVYIDDGSGNFSPDRIEYPYGNVDTDALFPTTSIRLSVQEGTLPDRGYLVLGDNPTEFEVVEYNGLSYDGLINVVQLVSATTKNHLSGEGFVFVKLIDDETTSSNRFYNLADVAIVEENFVLFCEKPGTPKTTVILEKYDPVANNDADYLLAPGIGQIELIEMTNVPTGSRLFSWYVRYGGLIQETQRVLDGDIRSPIGYPGARAAGVNLVVKAPVYVGFDIMTTLVLSEGVNAGAQRERADRIIRNYVNELNCGESFIITEMIRRVKSDIIVDMITDLPEANIKPSENEVLFIRNLSVN